MNAYNYFLAFVLAMSSCRGFAQVGDVPARIDGRKFDPATLLWYTQPARRWEEALPVGNGRIGAMVYGGAGEEHLQLNESTYWTGGPYSTVVKGGYRELPEIRRLVLGGKFVEAQKLFGRALMGYPVEQQKYQSLADLLLHFEEGPAEVEGYKRWLDLETGITGVDYKRGGVHYHRDLFVSAADDVLVMRIYADRAGAIALRAELRGVRNQTHSDYATDYFRMDGEGDSALVLTGRSADYMGVKSQLRYAARLKAVASGGTMRVSGDELVIERADTVTLVFCAATNFVNYKDVSGDANVRVKAILRSIAGKPYGMLVRAHAESYNEWFSRVKVQLPAAQQAYSPTDERIRADSARSDPSLAALAYQFGRYILMSASRPGGQAANLQGIWNKDMNPMWDSKYTTNINLQMAYWPAEEAQLPECVEPLIDLVKDVTDQGSQVAKEHYGCRGWVLHQNTDLWRAAAPMDGPTWGTFTTGGAWLCTHLWDHYLYSMDTAYLRSVYDVIRGSVQFFMDYLVPEAGSGLLVTNPSTSPENFPARPGNGPYFDEVTGSMLPGTTICAGSAIDRQIIDDLFADYVKAAAVFGIDSGFATEVARARARLLPQAIGKDGLLREWADDWGQLEPQHRHLSPLYGLYPGGVFSIERTPALAEACRKVLEQRGDGSSGWSRAWKAACWARLHNGDRAWHIFNGYLRQQANLQLLAKCGAPMQIDGTMGMAAAIGEMLLQSQEGVIEVLPALPMAWRQGSFSGLAARGAFVVDAQWSEGRVREVKVYSKRGGLCRLRCRGSERVVEIATVRGKLYTVHLK
jgi:alpha-L-fucosidase 2